MKVRGQLTYSATDLVGFSACAHLTALDREVALGRRVAPDRAGPLDGVLAAEGLAHEANVLADFADRGPVVTIPADLDILAAAVATADAMAAGAPTIYQGSLVEIPWVGRPDFLIRVERPSGRWAWSYEPLDVKLHREARAADWLQVAFYAQRLEAVQGSAPVAIHLVLAAMATATAAYAVHRDGLVALESRFLAAVGADGATRPEPVSRCGLCRWQGECRQTWAAEDHLTLVGARGPTRQRLAAAGVRTVAELAALPRGTTIAGVAVTTARRLRSDAGLIVAERATGRPHFRLRYPEQGEGLDALPPACAGDLFFDLEGYPFDGREYLFGVASADGGTEAYRHWWAHDRAAERAALEAFVARVRDERLASPGMHVYHYSTYEPRALARLAATHGCCTDEVQAMAEGGILFDLLPIVRRAVRLSSLRSGLKAVAPFAGYPLGEGEVVDGGGSIVTYRAWLADRDPALLNHLLAYNRADCLALRSVRDWLVALAKGVRSRSHLQAQAPGGRTVDCGLVPPSLVPIARTADPLERLTLAHDALAGGHRPDSDCLNSLRRRALVALDYEGLVPLAGVAEMLHMSREAVDAILIEGKKELGLPLAIGA